MAFLFASRAATSARPLALARDAAATVGIAAGLFVVAYENGFFGAEARGGLAVAVWWSLALGTLVGVWRLATLRGSAAWVGAALAGLTIWTLASTAWSSSSETVVSESARTALYLGVFLLATLAGGARGRWLDAIVLGIAAVAATALASRFFPHAIGDRGLAAALPAAESRLSFPLGYWNGLAIFVGLGAPAAAGIALQPRSAAVRGAAAGVLPALGATIYLASSRGGAAAALAGALTLLALAEDRWAALGTLVFGAAASVAAVVFLSQRPQLVNGPLSAAAAEGRGAAAVVAAICVGSALLYAGLLRAAPERRPPAALGWILLALAIVLAAGAAAVSHPRARLHAFQQPPTVTRYANANFVQAHLLSGAGSGRWQFWHSAIDEWRAHPLLGGGAGSFEQWWDARGSIAYPIADAHSLYLETLGELGIVGLVLLLAAFGVGVVSGAVRARRVGGTANATLAALTGVVVAYLVGAGLDWMWELPAVTVVAVVALGLTAAPAPAGEPRRPTRAPRLALAVFALLSLVVAGAEVVPVYAAVKLDDSRRAAAAADLPAAASAARTARTVEPWASTPPLQLALVAEQAGDLPRAESWIRRALAHDPRNWRLWLVAARVETKLGRIDTARQSLARARALNPRSPLFGRR